MDRRDKFYNNNNDVGTTTSEGIPYRYGFSVISYVMWKFLYLAYNFILKLIKNVARTDDG